MFRHFDPVNQFMRIEHGIVRRIEFENGNRGVHQSIGSSEKVEQVSNLFHLFSLFPGVPRDMGDSFQVSRFKPCATTKPMFCKELQRSALPWCPIPGF
jgi:hypothetical protein